MIWPLSQNSNVTHKLYLTSVVHSLGYETKPSIDLNKGNKKDNSKENNKY